jgi:Tfp pilus assembly pilus retraction ATPase PilT
MNLESFIALAKEHGASDLHLEPGLPMALRVLGGRFQEKISCMWYMRERSGPCRVANLAQILDVAL